MPRSPRALMRLPLVSELLMRSPVEARCAGVADIVEILQLRVVTTTSSPQGLQVQALKPRNPPSGLIRRTRSGMNRNQSDDVIVHDVSKEQQQEHKPHLNKALFNRHAHIAAHQTFNSE